MSMGISAATWGMIGAGAAVGGTLLGASAAGNAADAQYASAQEANATQKYMYDLTRADQAPWRDAGRNALTQLVAGLQPGGDYSRRFSAADLAADPVYNSGLQFGLDEGRKGLERQAAAGGNLLSGATLKALSRFGSDYASTKAGDAYNRFTNDMTTDFNRRAAISGVGQTATNAIAQAGQNYANNVSQNQLAAGNARGASYIGQANAINSGIGNVYNMGQTNRLLGMMGNGGWYGSGGGF